MVLLYGFLRVHYRQMTPEETLKSSKDVQNELERKSNGKFCDFVKRNRQKVMILIGKKLSLQVKVFEDFMNISKLS